MSVQTPEKPVTNNTPERAEPSNVVVKVGKMITSFLDNRTLHLPSDYSPENALKSAWLILQTVADRDGKPALQVCTQESIVNALLDMVVQGLNPAKKQCYFIVYGKSLTCQRSYFGDQALAERVKPGIEIYSGVIYDGDVFEYERIRGRLVVVKHTTKLENQKMEKIVGAYSGIYDKNTGEDLGSEVMTFDQIKKSWGMSKTYKPGGNSPHNNYPDQMALRTVIRRRIKPIINASTDVLLLQAVNRQDREETDAQMAAEIAERGNGEPMALMPSAPIEMQQQPVREPEPVVTAPATEEKVAVAATTQPNLGTEEEEPPY